MKLLEFSKTQTQIIAGRLQYRAEGVFLNYYITEYKDRDLPFALMNAQRNIGQFRTFEEAEKIANQLHASDIDELIKLCRQWEVSI